MGAIKPEKHDSMRKWAADNKVDDPENLIMHTASGSIVYKSPHAMKAYKRIKKMYLDSRDQRGENDLELMPMNLRADSSLRGYLFIAFIALILRMKLMRMMNHTQLSKRYSVEGLITELEKIKVMILPDGQKITTEISKKQRKILDVLDICA